MRNDSENKTTTPAETKDPKTCPKCRQPTGPRACRDARDGWYCVQFGLTFDMSRLRTSGGDPERRAAERAPAVVEAADRVTVAEAVFSETDRAWEDALRARAEVDLAMRRDEGIFNPFDGGWRVGKAAKQAARKVPALADAVDRATRARDRAGEALSDARRAHAAALNKAYRDRGLAVYDGNAPKPEHTVPFAY